MKNTPPRKATSRHSTIYIWAKVSDFHPYFLKVRGSVGGAYPPVVALRLTEAFTVSPQSVRPAPGMFLKDSRMGACASLLQRDMTLAPLPFLRINISARPAREPRSVIAITFFC